MLKGTNISHTIPFNLSKNKMITKNQASSLIHHKLASESTRDVFNVLNPEGNNKFMYIHADDEYIYDEVYYPNPDDEDNAMYIGIERDCIDFDYHKRYVGEVATFYDNTIVDVESITPLSSFKNILLSPYGCSRYSFKRIKLYNSITFTPHNMTLTR